MGSVVLQYQISFEEFRRGLVRATPLKSLAVIAGLLIFFVLYGAAAKDWGWIFFGGGFVVVFAFMALVATPRRYWKAGIGLQEPRTITLSDAGILNTSPSLEMKLEWSRFGRVRETKEFFILMPKKRVGAFMILKRGLVAPGDEQRLRALFATHLSRSVQ